MRVRVLLSALRIVTVARRKVRLVANEMGDIKDMFLEDERKRVSELETVIERLRDGDSYVLQEQIKMRVAAEVAFYRARYAMNVAAGLIPGDPDTSRDPREYLRDKIELLRFRMEDPLYG